MCSCAASVWLNHSVHHSALVSLMDVQTVQGAGNLFSFYLSSFILTAVKKYAYLLFLGGCVISFVISALAASSLILTGHIIA